MAAPEATPVLAIVGAGFSGTLLASQLLRQVRPVRLLLIERTGRFGPGVAYATADPGHLLNVSTGGMSAWPEDPSHLLRWLDLNQEALADLLPNPIDASGFLPRRVYGLYLESVLKEAEALAPGHTSLQRITADVLDVEPLPGSGAWEATGSRGYRLHLSDQAPLLADQVVLAWGNSALPPPLQTTPAIRHGWSSEAIAELDPEASVALLGTGLTMVDQVVSLQRRGHRGPILAFSRHGHRPNAHRAVPPIGDWLDPEGAPTTVLGLWRRIRKRVQEAALQGHDWRAVIDGLRPRTQELWRRLDRKERRRFLRHGAAVWDVHRHRIAPELDALLTELLASGRLKILPARLLNQALDGKDLRLWIRRRGAAECEELRVARLILCTGIPLDYAREPDTLVGRLRERGMLLSDALGLGAQCDPGGALLDGSGTSQATLHTLGSPRKGQLWESIAVPELRVQAHDLAQRLLRSLPPQLQDLAPQAAPLAAQASATGGVLLRQLFDAQSCTYTYLIADPTSGQAALLDPVLEKLERDISLLQDLGLSLSFCLETHLHADHITAAGQLRRRTGCRLVVPAAEGIDNADQLLLGGERLVLGSLRIEAIATPGHTPEHMAYRIGDTLLFSGDALLIRGCGRTDFQNGDPAQLYDSLQRLLSLPAEMLVYPCHDYQGRSHTSIGEERRLNPKLAGRNREAFIQLMQQQRLAPPARIAEALPANRHLGDLQPAGQHDQEIEERQRQLEQAQATEEANREIYNAFLGMFI